MSEEKLGFQAEVGRLLEIVANSLYSEREIFLRELISNASDACDRLRYAALTRPELASAADGYRVTIAINGKARTLSVTDNGIGMNRQELIDDLGTIARSGTAAFVEQLTGDREADLKLIGEFGVGFYAAFMVADRVEVLTRRAGEDGAWRWRSDGKGEFTIAPAEHERVGTTVVVHLSKDQKEFLEPARIRQIVKTYSDHIPIPIVLLDADGKEEKLNTASALWTRPKKDISQDQYREFYHHVGHTFDDPWLTVHVKAEGTLSFTALIFVPSMPPFDLFDPTRKHRVKLYVQRVFITEDCAELVPAWLRFVRGIVDSEDLPLNISRETLQHNPMLARIRARITKRLLSEMAKQANKDPDGYAEFWDKFGAVMKEGLYEDAAEKDQIIELARFRSSAGDGWTTLDRYVENMKQGQDAIYYITGDAVAPLRSSPQIEGYRARGVEVLLLTDPVDEFWVPALGAYKDKPFKSVTRGTADLDAIKPEPADKGDAEDQAEAAPDGNVDKVLALFKMTLKDEVKDVRVSERLTDSPVCLVADEGDLDMHIERLLRQHRRVEGAAKRILEINPRHPLMRRLAERVGTDGAADEIADVAWLLLDQARIVEGETPPDPAAFSRRLAGVLERGLARVRPEAPGGRAGAGKQRGSNSGG
ncbi:MAG: molecular chaperone HtpG [Kiloniellales bacterium]